jgi:hypothetical protein
MGGVEDLLKVVLRFLYALEYKTQQLGHVKDCVGLQAVQGFF